MVSFVPLCDHKFHKKFIVWADISHTRVVTNELLIWKVKADSVEFALQANDSLQGLQQRGALVLAQQGSNAVCSSSHMQWGHSGCGCASFPGCAALQPALHSLGSCVNNSCGVGLEFRPVPTAGLRVPSQLILG